MLTLFPCVKHVHHALAWSTLAHEWLNLCGGACFILAYQWHDVIELCLMCRCHLSTCLYGRMSACLSDKPVPRAALAD